MQTLVLNTTTKSLEAVLLLAVNSEQPDFTCAYADYDDSVFIEGESDGALDSTNPVTLITSPSDSTRRIIRSIVIHNNDDEFITLIIQYNNNGTVRRLYNVILQPRETFTLDGVYDESYRLKIITYDPITVGNVFGPESSNDNRIVRFDGVTGKIVQNSLMEVSDTGDVNIPVAQTYNINSIPHIHDDRYYIDSEVDDLIATLSGTVGDNTTNISSLSGTVATNTDAIELNTTHRTSDGTDHSYIDQNVTTTASPIHDGIYSTILNANDDTTYISNVNGQLKYFTGTGCIKIKSPSVVGNNYSNYNIRIMVMSQYHSPIEYIIQARWLQTYFDHLNVYSTSAEAKNYQVAAGNDGTNIYFTIGEETTSWDRVSVKIIDIFMDYMYDDIDTFKNGWEISLDDDVSDITFNETVTNTDLLGAAIGTVKLLGQTLQSNDWTTIATTDEYSATGKFFINRADQIKLFFTVAISYNYVTLTIESLVQLDADSIQGIRVTTDKEIQIKMGAIYTSSVDIVLLNSDGYFDLANIAATGSETTNKEITVSGTELGYIHSNDLIVNGTFELSAGTSVNEFSTDGTFTGDSDDAVPTEKAVNTLVTVHTTSDGSSHTFIDQDITIGSSPTFSGTNITDISAAQITDFDTTVSGNSAVVANTAKVGVTTEISSLSEDANPKLGGAFDADGNPMVAADHGTATTAQVGNVVYGTSTAPTASGTPIGTIYIKYTE